MFDDAQTRLQYKSHFIISTMQIRFNIKESRYLQATSSIIDKNYSFLCSMNEHRQEIEQLNMKDLTAHISMLEKKLKQLDTHELQEWISIQRCKIKQLADQITQTKSKWKRQQSETKIKSKAQIFKQQIRIFVFACKLNNIGYDQQELAKIIKQVYFDEYKEDILQQFQKAGYSTYEFEVLRYKESSFLGICCCWDDQ